jgi:hypothetical protein
MKQEDMRLKGEFWDFLSDVDLYITTDGLRFILGELAEKSTFPFHKDIREAIDLVTEEYKKLLPVRDGWKAAAWYFDETKDRGIGFRKDLTRLIHDPFLKEKAEALADDVVEFGIAYGCNRIESANVFQFLDKDGKVFMTFQLCDEEDDRDYLYVWSTIERGITIRDWILPLIDRHLA